ncbi:outer membrane receptor protein involved in Fe transport [Caulobacter rhizosphaerae]|uniref:Outer membrane receptor protein involved in Fe transport n=1 Tax=Caulobacter rhizosphaerae TaxID=2010972 RepID=A0ABU1N3V2_9CAUL|nr:outer membrane receptor protein involved in Fe transport [Caulobacter rhizosphaerae]
MILVPVSGLSLSASLSVIKPKYKSFVTASGDFTSNRLAQVPEKQFTIGAHYTLPVPASVGEIRLGADYYHQSEVYFTDTTQGPAFGPDASQKQAGYGLLNIKADWDHIGGSNIGASLYVQNALAEKYLTYGVILYPSLGFNSATVGDPRVFGFELRYSW